jgi:hypothetical protein
VEKKLEHLAPGRPDGTSRPDTAPTPAPLPRPHHAPRYVPASHARFRRKDPRLPGPRPAGETHGCAQATVTATGHAVQHSDLLLQHPDETFVTYI